MPKIYIRSQLSTVKKYFQNDFWINSCFWTEIPHPGCLSKPASHLKYLVGSEKKQTFPIWMAIKSLIPVYAKLTSINKAKKKKELKEERNMFFLSDINNCLGSIRPVFSYY